LKLLDSARYLGGLRAVELACFHRLGERAPRLAEAACARWAASASLAHAWRASAVESLLPVSVGLPGLAELTVIPEGQLAEELDRALPELALEPHSRSRDSLGDDARLLVAGLCGRLYPLVRSEYSRRLELASLAADGPVIRVIGRVVADLEAVRSEGSSLLGEEHA